jgi:hypothetical protein
MARLPCILSIALLVIHLMVDCCCACHAHSCESGHVSSATHDATPLGMKCPECLCDHSHHDPLKCRGCNCSWALPRRPVGGLFSLKIQASCAALTDADLPRPAIKLHKNFLTARSLLLSVRLHLANQVLLI